MSNRQYVYAVNDVDYHTSTMLCIFPDEASAQKIAHEVNQLRKKYSDGIITRDEFDAACQRYWDFEYQPSAYRDETEVGMIEIRPSII